MEFWLHFCQFDLSVALAHIYLVGHDFGEQSNNQYSNRFKKGNKQEELQFINIDLSFSKV